MSTYLKKAKGKIGSIIRNVPRFCHKTKKLVIEQFNKNIYTRILFTNVIFFVIVLAVLATLSNFAVKQATYDQVQQELLRKAKGLISHYCSSRQRNGVLHQKRILKKR